MFTESPAPFPNGPSRREELLKLRAKLAAAEQSRLSGEPVYSLEESRRQLEEILS